MRLFAFLGSLLVLVLVAALVVPPYVDWNQFKTRFETEASKALGLPVKVLGQASARLLPLPSITFTKLRIGEGEKPILTAESFKLDVELAPLLKGDVVIVDMQLSYPAVKISLDDNGRLKLPEIAGQRVQFQNADVALENISISNGVFLFEDERSSRKIMIQNVDARASAKALLGPWQVEGTGNHKDRRFRMTGSTGLVQESGQIRVSISIEPQSLPYDFDFSGPFALKDGVPSLAGLLQVSRMGKQSDNDLILFRRPHESSALPIRLESALDIVSGGATASAFKLDIGSREDPYTLTGNGQAIFGDEVSFRIRAEGQQVNVDRLDSASAKGMSLSERLDTLRSFLSHIPRFDADGEINLYLPAVIAGDTVVREIGMDLRPAKQGVGWLIKNLEAQFPGRTDLRADGTVLLGDAFGYEGELVIASKQPSGFAKWLGSSVSPAIRDLASAGFAAQAHISKDVIQFNNAEIILGKSSLKGNIRRERKEGDRPTLVAKLEGDAVDFDQLNSLFGLFTKSGTKNFIEAHDLDLDINARSMSMSKLHANDVVAKIAIKEGALVIDSLKLGDMAGALVNVTGAVTGLPDQLTGKLSTQIVARDPAPFLSMINNRFGPYPLVKRLIEDPYVIADTKLNIEFEGKDGKYSVAVNGQTGGSEIEANLTGDKFNKPLGLQSIESKFVLVNNETSQLLLQLGFPVVPLSDTGRGAFRLSASGVVEAGLRSEAALTTRDGYLSAAGIVKPLITGDQFELSGALNVSGEVQDADPFILLSGMAIPGFGDGMQVKISTHVKFDKSKFIASKIMGKLGGSKFAGNANLNVAKKPRPNIEGTLSFSVVDAGALAGLVYTGTPGSAFTSGLRNGDGVETTDGVEPILSGLDADLQLDAISVLVSPGIPTAENLSTKLAVRDGDMHFDNLKANWFGGAVSGSISMAQTSATRIFNGQIKLQNTEIAKVSKLAKFPEGFTGKLTMAGTFESAGPDVKSMISKLTASGTASVELGSVAGLNGKAFNEILRTADTIADEKITKRTGRLVSDRVSTGTFSFGASEFPFSIASGIARANNVILTSEMAQLVGAARHNLTTGTSELDARVSYFPGREEVVGANPELDLKLSIEDGKVKRTIDSSLFATYLGMRVSERREREFEAQRSEILERQRLLLVARLYSLQETAKRIAVEERERIKELELEQEKQRKLDEARRRREELERKLLQAKLDEAEKQAAREAALEAGRREKRQQQIELLRQQSRDATKRLCFDCE